MATFFLGPRKACERLARRTEACSGVLQLMEACHVLPGIVQCVIVFPSASSQERVVRLFLSHVLSALPPCRFACPQPVETVANDPDASGTR